MKQLAVLTACVLLMGSFVIILPSSFCVQEKKLSRFDVTLSHMMYRNIITLANEFIDPIEEIIFRVVQASG